MPIEIFVGDITTCSEEAIVNAADESLTPGGGVCGAIHQAAGPQLAEACREIGHCPTGQAVITPGFQLKAKYVIHTVGPRWRDGLHGEQELLRQCYQSIFHLVNQYQLKSIAIPAISTGIYGFPIRPATEIAVNIAKKYQENSPRVLIRFVCYEKGIDKIYEELLNA